MRENRLSRSRRQIGKRKRPQLGDDEAPTIVKRIGFLTAHHDHLTPVEMAGVPLAPVDVGPVFTRPFEPTEEPTASIHSGQSGFDRGSGSLTINQGRTDDEAVKVHRPIGCAPEPENLLPNEVRTAEIAVAVLPLSIRSDEVLGASPARLSLRSTSDVTGRFCTHDDITELVHGSLP